MSYSPQSTILSMLHGRAGMRPDEVGFTFTDYTADPAGAVERVTWSQLYRRTLNAAAELRLHASVGDRAVILAPQGMEYITAFLGCMQAGVIAVPLPLPHRGSGDDRVSAVVDDTAPSIVLTTSAVTADVAEYLDRARLGAAPKILDVDAMDLDGPADEGADSASGYPATAYLQYSSGSTRRPTGVMVSHRNLKSNFEQLMRGYFAESQINTNGMTIVSWLPFYHDMGLVLGVCAPILGGFPAALTSPVAFLEKPSRWMQALADNARPFSAAPNFAFELAARKTRDADLAGRDLGGVLGIINGAERVDPATLERFADRFSHFNFRDSMLRPSYGLAEATVFVAAGTWKESEPAVRFDADELAAGRVRRATKGGTALVRYQLPKSPVVRIVDADTCRESAADVVGEIWVHGDNVAAGYWGLPPESQQCFGTTLLEPSTGTPDGPWLRTGDLGFVFGGELFIVGRVKDLLIIRGRNHYPEDIEATVQEISGGRVAAISVSENSTENLVTVIEVKERGDSAEAVAQGLHDLKNDITAAITKVHGVSAGDLVLVAPGSIPTTTSGKIRRAACAELYRDNLLARLG